MMTKTPPIHALLGALLAATPGCVLLAGGFPDGRSGTLTTVDGAPVPGADVIVESWTTEMRGEHIARQHVYTTKTGGDGRWAVPPRPSVVFAMLLGEGSASHADDYTFRSPGEMDLHVAFPPAADPPDETEVSTMRADGSGPPPLAAVRLLVVGGAFGAGQKASAHLGEMFVVSRGGFGAGARLAVEAGVNGAGTVAGLVVVPVGATFPNLAAEVNARVLRPWRSGTNVESGPELALDLLGYRFTLAWLGPSVDTPIGARRVVVGFGFGYF